MTRLKQLINSARAAGRLAGDPSPLDNVYVLKALGDPEVRPHTI